MRRLTVLELAIIGSIILIIVCGWAGCVATNEKKAAIREGKPTPNLTHIATTPEGVKIYNGYAPYGPFVISVHKDKDGNVTHSIAY